MVKVKRPKAPIRRRVKTAEAVSLTGLEPRTIRDMAALGQIPGAAKPRGIWTFDLDLLKLFVRDSETQVRQNAKVRQHLVGKSSSSKKYNPMSTSTEKYTQVIKQIRAAATLSGKPKWEA